MRILALETTERLATVAALCEGKLLAEAAIRPGERSAQGLAPALKQVLQQALWQPREVELVAVASGPGSFTGLRVGVTTAKTFAYAVGAEVLGVNTLEVIARRAPAEVSALAVALDAQRQQVFAAEFRRDETGQFQWHQPTQVVDQQQWLASLRPPLAVSGPVLAKLRSAVPAGVTVLDASRWTATAAAVGAVALRHYRAGARSDLWQLAPNYFRESAAEEKWRARQPPG